MRIILARLFLALYNLFCKESEKKLLLSACSQSLNGLVATVFITECKGRRVRNDCRITHYVEQELIERGARVVVVDRKAALRFLKEGSVQRFAAEANVAFIGELVQVVVAADISHEDNVEYVKWTLKLSFRLIATDGTI